MTNGPYAAQQQVITGKVEFAGRIVVLAIGLLLLSRNITSPFSGWREENSATFSIFARNHIRYGLEYTKMFCTYGDAILPSTEPQRYLHHPPLVAIWAAIPMLIFGDHEWVSRLVPIATTLGSVWVLMIIVGRLQSPLLGLLTGFFYVMFPIIAYFGRVLCHESPVQFFSLLMLYGYLQWRGFYGDGYSRKSGAAYYLLGAILGIGTGWAVAIMAGLIWLWHTYCCLRRRSSGWSLLLVTLILGISISAVLLHIFWGSGWKVNYFVYLLVSRSLGTTQIMSWPEWFRLNWIWFTYNFSVFGLIAAVIYLLVICTAWWFKKPLWFLKEIISDKVSVLPIFLTALQGAIWLFVFKLQSGVHDYWQYFTAPFFAVVMAAVVIITFNLLSKLSPLIAFWVVVAMVLLPVPFFAKSLDTIYNLEPRPGIRSMIASFKKLQQLVPRGVPVMTSEDYQSSESFGNYSNRWTLPQAAYYANRPLIYTTDINEIEANRQNCAAYILRATNDPNMYQLAQQLDKKHRLVAAEGDYMNFLLNPPEKNAK